MSDKEEEDDSRLEEVVPPTREEEANNASDEVLETSFNDNKSERDIKKSPEEEATSPKDD